MVFVNETQAIGLWFGVMNNDMTGSAFLSAMLILVVLMFVGFAFRLPLEYQSAYILPLMLVYMAYSDEFLVVGGVILLFMSVVFSKYIFFNDK